MKRYGQELCEASYEAGSSIEDGLKLRCICWRMTYVNCITLPNQLGPEILNLVYLSTIDCKPFVRFDVSIRSPAADQSLLVICSLMKFLFLLTFNII